MTQTTLQVAISRFHQGQIVTPTVTATVKGVGRKQAIHVDLYWLDRSDNTRIKPASCDCHTADEAERFLMAQGVHLDAQGVHGFPIY